ncbi:hypothetical protein [Streptomyces sp. CoH17]|uniref:hypothetical protein n=1 Tax=Streptomyces sp. CoH17 TaxID=2992806 RepID=UPI0022714202|nr:hypothetical protein [Streptomyces sp. CoH17]
MTRIQRMRREGGPIEFGLRSIVFAGGLGWLVCLGMFFTGNFFVITYICVGPLAFVVMAVVESFVVKDFDEEYKVIDLDDYEEDELTSSKAS